MKLTTNSQKPLTASAAAKRDAWDDEVWDDEESGPSWFKSFVGGAKYREYSR